jgi:hypothetical protein
MAQRGRPVSRWRDWEGREGTVYQMCAWHDVTRAALYQRRPIRDARGVWVLPPPKRPRTDRNRA